MKTKLVHYLYPGLAAILILLLAATAACTAEQPDGAPSDPTDAATDAGARTSSAPLIDRELVAEFADAQTAINADWDQFHVDFDGWRATLSACDRTAALAAFRNFAGDFGDISEQAKSLPGTGLTRELPYKVVDAALFEEDALVKLRDNWQPGNTELQAAVKQERDNASRLLRETADRLDELEELDKPEEREAATEFSEALAPINDHWDAFYDDYDALLEEQADLYPEEVIARLEPMVDAFDGNVVKPMEDLPSDKATEAIAESLLEAAEAELDEVNKLLDSFRELSDASKELEKVMDEVSQAVTDAQEKAAEAEAEQSAGQQEQPTPPKATPTPMPDQPEPPTTDEPEAPPPDDNSDLFTAMDEQIELTREVRKTAEQDLENLIEGVSEEDLAALDDFSAAFNALQQDWDDFHEDYDGWVRVEGDCDRAAAIAELNDFNRQFSVLSSRVRDLSQASYLRPSSDLMVEATAREGAALRSLAGAWAPYENDVYRGLADERANAANLRRLADRRIQEMLERNGMGQ